MTKNKFLDDLINRLEEISRSDRGIPSAVLINSDEAKELLESDYVKRDELTADDIPQSIIDSIYEDGERAGYEQGSFASEKVKVPAYVAKWIEEKVTATGVFEAISVLYGYWQADDLDLKVENWVNHGKGSQKKLLSAIVNGYEVEEDEKLYRIYEPTTQRYLTFSAGHYVWFSGKHDDVKQQFTEKEIKNLDERLWAFAVED
ncbi:DUF1642 domain-containing protein [Aerococcus sp. 1KP-2016]|uniref:DUF1642 domain-containing protein n=1 Tax=Aerococcus sp. 1KP-2016 TaxID=1981982 RepID=UPI000B97E448|nr:DUF1642 domain-containing protein [Aerococcus sp. 1KP-2016]OYQ68288.1 hypothetical protein B9P78_00320 [Aerococcus sp. 1KP-2016]